MVTSLGLTEFLNINNRRLAPPTPTIRPVLFAADAQAAFGKTFLNSASSNSSYIPRMASTSRFPSIEDAS
jgi:hypothetical protein